MSSVRFLSPQENLLDTVLTYLPVDRDDYSSCAVLFQGKRPAHFLRKELAMRRGRACVPPAIFSLESYIDFCYHELLGMTGNDIAPLDAIAILFEEHRAMVNRIGGEGFVRLESFFSLGLRLFDALEELRLHTIPMATLRAALPLSDFPSGERLATFYDRFYHRLIDEGLVTRATKALRVADRIGDLDLGMFERVLVAGFYSFTPVEETIIAQLKGLEKTVFLFQNGPGVQRRVESLGFEELGETSPFSLPRIHYVRAQGTHGEILGLNRLLTDPDSAPPMDERTVIVLPSSDALFPVTEWTLPLVPEGNVNVSLGYPASRTPAFGFLESLLNLLDSRDGDRFFAPDYVRFILHPYTKNLAFHGHPEPTRILFHTIEDTLASTLGGAFFELERLEQDSKLHAMVALAAKDYVPELTPADVAIHLKAIHDLCIRTPMHTRTFGEFASSMREILTFVDDHSVARMHGLFRRFVAALMEALEAIRESRLASHSDREGKSYGLLVLHALRQVNVPFPGTPVRGVQVLGLLETRNLQFENVFVLDVNDDVLPGSPDVDPLLPAAVRAVLKLPQSFERQEAIEHYFMVLLAGAKNVHLLYREGAAVRRSRFIERVIWEEERRAGALANTDPARPVDDGN